MSIDVRVKSNYRGSPDTYELVKKQIAERWNQQTADEYNPEVDVMTYKKWLENGRKVRLGEKALRSMTMVEKKDDKGNITKFPRQVCLFHHLQTRKLRDDI